MRYPLSLNWALNSYNYFNTKYLTTLAAHSHYSYFLLVKPSDSSQRVNSVSEIQF